MEMLSDGDIRLMLGFLHEASEVDGQEVFTEPVVEAFWQLIPADAGAACNTFTGASRDVVPEARTLLSFAEIGSEWCINLQTKWTDELEEICRTYIERQDPIPPVPQFVNRVVRLVRRDQPAGAPPERALAISLAVHGCGGLPAALARGAG